MLTWTKHPGPRMARTNKQARATYKAGEYTLRWVGSTHGVWTVEYQGSRLTAGALLKDVKTWAEKHHAGR